MTVFIKFNLRKALLITASIAGIHSFNKWKNGPSVPKEIIDKSDLTNKTIIITGVAPGGIGYETVKTLYQLNGTIILAVRDISKGKQTKQQIEQEIKTKNGKLYVMQIDLNDLQSVKEFTNNFQKQFDYCHFLINNAGIFMPPHSITKQSIEKQFGVNYLGPFLLTNLLLNLNHIKNFKDNFRIINVASRAHLDIKEKDEILYNFKDKSLLVDNDGREIGNVYQLYKRSKLANVLFTKKLDKLLQQEYLNNNLKYNKLNNNRPICCSLHPGLVGSNILQSNTYLNYFGNFFIKLFAKTPYYGAQTTLYCVLSNDIKGGEYYADCKVTPSSEVSMNESVQNELWDTSMELCKDYLE
ncbi:hypothetical protein ABK040_014335 [Willaertia magna]